MIRITPEIEPGLAVGESNPSIMNLSISSRVRSQEKEFVLIWESAKGKEREIMRIPEQYKFLPLQCYRPPFGPVSPRRSFCRVSLTL